MRGVDVERGVCHAAPDNGMKGSAKRHPCCRPNLKSTPHAFDRRLGHGSKIRRKEVDGRGGRTAPKDGVLNLRHSLQAHHSDLLRAIGGLCLRVHNARKLDGVQINN